MNKILSRAIAIVLFGTSPAFADTELGIIGAELRLGYSDQTIEGGFVAGTVDVAITDVHGAQFDLQYEERSNGGIGRFGTVIYMTPDAGQKYGLSLMVADKNDASSTYGQIGAAGMFSIAPGWNAEVRAGAGISADNDLDWITAGGGLYWQITDKTRVYGHYDIASFDEQNFGATAHDITFGVQTQFGTGPAALFAEASRDWLNGRNATDADTTIRFGVSVSLGRTGNNQPSFRVSDPLRQILRRGLY